MIVNWVSTLTSERRLSIQAGALDWGLAYSTVFSLCHDKANRYDRETLDKLCGYSGWGFGDLLAYRRVSDERGRGE